MKSPWKFLVELTSRGRAAEMPAASIEDDAKTTAIESEAQQVSVLPLNSTEATDRPDHDDPPPVDFVATTSNETAGDLDAAPAILLPGDVEEIQVPVREKASQSSAEAPASVPQNERSRRSPPTLQTKRPARARKARTNVNAESTRSTNKDQTTQSPSPRETLLDEAISLDEEIRQLRRQLAQKLHLQNAQLKTLLQRFDVS
ncbi:hypothetical protein G6L99_30280 [Agrobacterium rhizogenes]|uniref:hypothetical protein n=1 Tax=Rhizobium rhizogenes TaxID=359 RepID=UPI001572A6F3|nr:hypothetical protein [Rhizobium rhizogenes]NTH16422.1 hypothetical protein [Rhizobium rhizogenes]